MHAANLVAGEKVMLNIFLRLCDNLVEETKILDNCNVLSVLNPLKFVFVSTDFITMRLLKQRKTGYGGKLKSHKLISMLKIMP